jgi:hypothetical protein
LQVITARFIFNFKKGIKVKEAERRKRNCKVGVNATVCHAVNARFSFIVLVQYKNHAASRP